MGNQYAFVYHDRFVGTPDGPLYHSIVTNKNGEIFFRAYFGEDKVKCVTVQLPGNYSVRCEYSPKNNVKSIIEIPADLIDRENKTFIFEGQKIKIPKEFWYNFV